MKRYSKMFVVFSAKLWVDVNRHWPNETAEKRKPRKCTSITTSKILRQVAQGTSYYKLWAVRLCCVAGRGAAASIATWCLCTLSAGSALWTCGTFVSFATWNWENFWTTWKLSIKHIRVHDWYGWIWSDYRHTDDSHFERNRLHFRSCIEQYNMYRNRFQPNDNERRKNVKCSFFFFQTPFGVLTTADSARLPLRLPQTSAALRPRKCNHCAGVNDNLGWKKCHHHPADMYSPEWLIFCINVFFKNYTALNAKIIVHGMKIPKRFSGTSLGKDSPRAKGPFRVP